MSEELINYKGNLPEIKQSEQFQMLLNKAPEQSKVVKTPDNKAEILPIGIIENTLDEIYSGLWKTTNFRYSVIANEIVGVITLHVYHPIFKMWLTREGASAKAIQMTSLSDDQKERMTKSERNIYAQDVTNKIPNCIEKQIGAVKSLATKNAAETLGVIFGRNLNRKHTDDYEPLSDQLANYSAEYEELMQLIDSSEYSDNQKQALKVKASKANIKEITNLINKLKK